MPPNPDRRFIFIPPIINCKGKYLAKLTPLLPGKVLRKGCPELFGVTKCKGGNGVVPVSFFKQTSKNSPRGTTKSRCLYRCSQRIN